MATDHKTVADEIADRNPRSFEARWRMRVHRIADQPLWNHPLARVVAVVADQAACLKDALPCFHRDDVEGVVAFLCERYLT